MNSSSSSWASYHRKWRLCLKDGKAGTGVFYGFIVVILSNIWFGDSNENALITTWECSSYNIE